MDYGARFYDPSIARFTTIDPLAEDYPAHSSYNYVLNNPIILVDPDGMAPEWYPRVSSSGRIQLVAEAGDNLSTLKSYFAGSSRFSNSQLEAAYNNAQGGVVVNLPGDNFSRALGYASENSGDFARPNQSNILDVSDNYNCYHHCLNGSTGGEIYDSWLPWANDMNYSDYKLGVDEATSILQSDFSETSSETLIYGKTVLAFRPTMGDGKQLYQHFAVYAGQDQKGNIYIHTKNGPRITPQIQKLSDFTDELPGGIENYTIDYFEPKE